MRTRIGKWMIAGALALTLTGWVGTKLKSVHSNQEVCKERTSEKNEKMIRSSVPIWENVTRHLIRL